MISDIAARTPPSSSQPSHVYEVRVDGLVPPRELLQEYGDTGRVEHEVRTVVRGRFQDQAALHGFLNRLRALGLEVIEVRRRPAWRRRS